MVAHLDQERRLRGQGRIRRIRVQAGQLVITFLFLPSMVVLRVSVRGSESASPVLKAAPTHV